MCVAYLLYDRKTLFHNRPKRGNGYFVLWLFTTVFCTYFAWGWDYLLYQKLLISGNDHIEPVYHWLYTAVNKNYLVWRCVVWGLSSLFLVLTLKRLKCDIRLASALFILLPLIQIYYVTRNTLGLSILLYALSFLDGKKKNLPIAAAWLFVSSFFHTSMPLYIALVILVFAIPVNKLTFIISIAAFPILRGAIIILSEMFLANSDNAEFASRGSYYASSDNEMQYTLVGWIHLAIQMTPILYIMFCGVMSAIKRKGLSILENRFLIYAYILIYLSFLFWGEASKHLQTRFWDASYQPLAFFLAMYLFPRRETKPVKFFIVMELLVFAYRLMYNIYVFDPSLSRII